MEVDKKLLAKMMAVADELFGTQSDPDQIPVTMDSWNRISRISKDFLSCRLTDDGELKGWAVVIPTTRQVMGDFLTGRISEKELMHRTPLQKEYDALYLCSVIVLPEYRRQGIAAGLLKELIDKAPIKKGAALFAWPFSAEGKMLVRKLALEYNLKIQLREKQ